MCSALPLLLGGFHRLGQGGVGEEIAAADGAVDAGEFLVDDAAGADVEVAYLGVAHLPAGQAHRRFGRMDGGVRVGLPEFVPVGLVRLAMALLSGLSLQPNPSRIMSRTGVTFMLEFSGSF